MAWQAGVVGASTRDQIAHEVVAARARVLSLADQLHTTQEMLADGMWTELTFTK